MPCSRHGDNRTEPGWCQASHPKFIHWGNDMRNRSLVALAATTLLAAGPLAGYAAAAEDDAITGVGTGSVSSTALSVELGADGDLLSIRVLGDDGTSTIDPVRGAAAASSTLRPFSVRSRTVPGLEMASPPVGSSSTGAEDKKSVSPETPNSPALAGTINAVLSSIVDAAGARSGLSAGLANLDLVGGLVRVPTGTVHMASQASEGRAAGTRTLHIPEIRVLDLAAVLDGLGLQLTDLSVTQILGLFESLGLQLPDLVDPADAVDALNAAIDTVQAAVVGPITAQLCGVVDGLLQGQLGGIAGLTGTLDGLPDTVETITGELPPLPIVDDLLGDGGLLGGGDLLGDGGLLGGLLGTSSVGSTTMTSAALLPGDFSCANLTGTVDDLLDTLQGALGMLLRGALVELGETSLLTIKDVKVSLDAIATDSIERSVADVTASIGEVQVGVLPVPGVNALDLGVPLAVLDQANAAIEQAVGSVLATLNASLVDLVDVDLLEITEVVGKAGEYTNAASTVTALRATITPPTGFGAAALLDLDAEPVHEVLGSLTTTVPVLAPAMAQLEAALGGVQALSGPSVVTIGQLSSNAVFRPVAGPDGGGPEGSVNTPGGDLPRTGGNAALPAMVAVTLAGMAFAIRRILRSATA